MAPVVVSTTQDEPSAAPRPFVAASTTTRELPLCVLSPTRTSQPCEPDSKPTSAKARLGRVIPSKMLGGASQTVSKIRVECNGTKDTHLRRALVKKRPGRRRSAAIACSAWRATVARWTTSLRSAASARRASSSCAPRRRALRAKRVTSSTMFGGASQTVSKIRSAALVER